MASCHHGLIGWLVDLLGRMFDRFVGIFDQLSVWLVGIVR